MSIGTLGRQGALYEPRVIERIQELHNNGSLELSAEFMMSEFEEESSGIRLMLDGRFSGVAIVNRGADRGNRVWVLASALRSDMELHENTILPHSFEWLGDKIAEKLSNANMDAGATVVGTFPDSFFYTANQDDMIAKDDFAFEPVPYLPLAKENRVPCKNVLELVQDRPSVLPSVVLDGL